MAQRQSTVLLAPPPHASGAVDVVPANPPTPRPAWWDEFLANAAIVRSRTGG